MEHLPDDVLLTVLEYVEVEDLLACRLVCKSLAELALNPEPWRHQRIRQLRKFKDDVETCFCPVLRLAPCARLLLLQLPPKTCQLSFTTTTCAISILKLRLLDMTVCTYAASVIRNQLALGRLRELHVWFPEASLSDIKALIGFTQTRFGFSLLLETLAAASGLETLSTHRLPMHTVPDRFVLHSTVPITSSLKHFSSQFLLKSELFIDFVLAGHSLTLEEVNLGAIWVSSVSISTSISTAPLLAGMPNLRELHCPAVLTAIEVVAACGSLRKVALHIEPNMPSAAFAGAAEFLRRATQLREVWLLYRPGASSPDDGGVGLVRDLTWSGRSRVELLSIDNGWCGDFPQQQPLLSALPALPALQHLRLEAAALPEGLLLALGPDTAPALQTLELGVNAMELEADKWCLHSWLHDNRIADTLLRVHPSIKILPPSDFNYYCSVQVGCTLCAWCKSGCHREMPGNYRSRFRDAMIKFCP